MSFSHKDFKIQYVRRKRVFNVEIRDLIQCIGQLYEMLFGI